MKETMDNKAIVFFVTKKIVDKIAWDGYYFIHKIKEFIYEEKITYLIIIYDVTFIFLF